MGVGATGSAAPVAQIVQGNTGQQVASFTRTALQSIERAIDVNSD